MNFQISVHWTALTSVHFISKYGAASLAEKVQDVDDLRQNLIDAWVGVEQSVIEDALISGADVSIRLHACIRATGGHFLYLSWHKLAKTLLTIIS